MMKKPREIRGAAGLSRARVAVECGVSEPTLRLYEIDPSSISPRLRPKIDARYSQLAATTVA
jgi:transcriptional regulator with XRE-family HTH domain